MGCVERYQWCNLGYPNMTGCGPLTSYFDAIYGAAPYFNVTNSDLESDRPSSPLDVGTRLIWSVLTWGGYSARLPVLIQTLGAKSLESQSRLYGGIQWPIPKNQWHLDVSHWFETALSNTQASFVNAASGQSAEPGLLLWHPLNEAEREICNSQVSHGDIDRSEA
jgi:hypothetical protein